MKKIIMTGIQPTGELHIGNYIGAINPMLKDDHRDKLGIFLIADGHSYAKVSQAKVRQDYIRKLTALLIVISKNHNNFSNLVIIRQSDLTPIFQIMWMLHKYCNINYLLRCHAYQSSKNISDNMCLLSYPLLMAADIIGLQSDWITVGYDQKQHIEFTKRIIKKINYDSGKDILKMPITELLTNNLLGTDGQKMSKTYNNTIPLVSTPEELRLKIMKIKTTNQSVGEPKNPDLCPLFSIYSHFVTDNNDLINLKQQYLQGIGWQTMKEKLFELLNSQFSELSKPYNQVLLDDQLIQQTLKSGSKIGCELGYQVLESLKLVI